MSDEIERAETPSGSAPESPESAERAGRGRKRNRRGKSNKNRQEPQGESAVSRESGDDRAAAHASPPPRAESRGPEPRRQRSQGFGDDIDHQVCAYCVPALPLTYPVHARQGIAVTPLHTVAEAAGVNLLCDQLHAGECAWPDLTPLDPSFAVSRTWSFVVQTGTDWFEPSVEQEPPDDSGR